MPCNPSQASPQQVWSAAKPPPSSAASLPAQKAKMPATTSPRPAAVMATTTSPSSMGCLRSTSLPSPVQPLPRAAPSMARPWRLVPSASPTSSATMPSPPALQSIPPPSAAAASPSLAPTPRAHPPRSQVLMPLTTPSQASQQVLRTTTSRPWHYQWLGWWLATRSMTATVRPASTQMRQPSPDCWLVMVSA